VNFAETIPIFIPGIFTLSVIDRLVAVAPLSEATVDVVLIGVDQAAGLDRLLKQRLNGRLLDILQHLNDNLATPLQNT
jgi:hypothetical protein